MNARNDTSSESQSLGLILMFMVDPETPTLGHLVWKKEVYV